MDSETLALAAEVAAALDNNSMASESSLLTPITLYRTGRILFATTCILHPSSSHDANNDTSSSSISTVFDKLLSSIDRDYVRNVLLHELHVAYANLIVSFASSSIRDTTSSLTSLMASTKSNYATKPLAECTAQDVIEATESLCGMYLSSITACRYCGSFQTNGDSDDDGSVNELDIVFASFSWVYQYIILDNMLDNTTSSSLDRLKEGLLKTISRILIHGIVVCQSTTSTTSEQESEDERLSNVVNVIQRIQSSGGGEYSYTMGDMLHLEEQKHHNDSFLQALNEQFNDGPQLQYFKVMLHGFLRSKPPEPTISSTKTNNPSNKMLLEPSVKQPPQTMLDVQINHIQSVLPDLGEGYIEEALKCYNHNIERTLDALLSGNNTIHPALSTLPKNLPRKLKDLPEQYTPNVNMHRGATFKDDGKEHVDRQKQYIKEAERKAEEEAYLVENVSRALGGLRVQGIQNNEVITSTITTDDFGITGNEYNDDYDDQYDGVGDDGGMAGGIGGLDEGLYDVDVHNVHQRYDRGGAKNDQDMWRQYNKLIKEVDSESQYWVSFFTNMTFFFI